ncbi:MAG: hypothetical protein Q9167_002341 [Letrouitia subvulpina]
METDLPNSDPSKQSSLELVPDPDLKGPDPSNSAPCPPGSGRDINEPTVALLADINASLKDIKDFSARFMKLVDLAEAENIQRQGLCHAAVVRSNSTSESVQSATKNSTSFTGSSDQSGDVVGVEQARQDCKRSISPKIRDEIIVIEEDGPVLNSREYMVPKGADSSARSIANKTIKLALKGYTHIHIEYGEFPHKDLYRQLFGDVWDRDSAYGIVRERLLDVCSAWLKEKRLIFSCDERCNFAFDTVALSRYRDLRSVQFQIQRIEEFARDLRRRGGFFFFRESCPHRVGNKIYNGTHVFRCENGMKEALPRFSAKRKNFCEEIPEIIPPWGHDREDQLLREIMEKREEATEREERSSNYVYGENHLDPCVIYHYKGLPTLFEQEVKSSFVIEDGYGNRSYGTEVRQRFQDPHLTGPWRRLCVLTGLSRISKLERDNIWEKVPLFPREHAIDTGKTGNLVGDETSDEISDDGSEMSNETSDERSDEPSDEGSECHDADFLEEGIIQHLNCEQLSMRQILRKRIVKFQFSWYELIPQDISEKYPHPRKYAGSGNSEKHVKHLIAPLKDILPTLSSTLRMVISRILVHWAKINEYIEKFIAGQDTFLDEDRHDHLLFDDDSFTRSRQYFWVINCIEEFVLIIDETINHYENVRKWVCPSVGSEWRKHEKALEKLKAMKQKFESQRNRATMLRDGLFSASAVFESRLSTRLAQNVKLLTYVSIFYLPLAFCAALWAIPNITKPSTRTPFIIAAVLVGFVTYFVVFNLDGLISLGWTAYSGFREKRIQQMSTDKGWQKCAQSYRNFQPDQGRTKPSEWYILLHALLYPFRRSEGPEETEENGEEDTSIAMTSISSQASGTIDAKNIARNGLEKTASKNSEEV